MPKMERVRYLLQPPLVISQPGDERLELGGAGAGAASGSKEDGWFPSPRYRVDSSQGMSKADEVVSKYVTPKYAKPAEGNKCRLCHFLMENTHPKRQWGQLVASLHGKPNPANPGKFLLGEGGIRDPRNPGPALNHTTLGWCGVQAEEKAIKALSSLLFLRLRCTCFTVGYVALLSAEKIKNN